MSVGPQNRNEAQIFAFEELRAEIQYQILRCLKEDGISQADLAKRLGCSAACVSQFLGDDANLTLESISKVFLALGRRPLLRTEPCNYYEYAGEGAAERSGEWLMQPTIEFPSVCCGGGGDRSPLAFGPPT